MIFSNYRKLATSPLRKKILTWVCGGIESVLPSAFMPKTVYFDGNTLSVGTKKFLISGRRIFVIGAGKASAAMGVALEKIIGEEQIIDGVIVTNDTRFRPHKIHICQVTHPFPSQKGVSGAKKILSLKTKYNINENDVIIALLSGGGSSLLPYPADGITLADKQAVTKMLVQSGANVHEMTIVKKKLSRVKGGKLARHFYPTPLVSLVLSDVVGNNLEVIASGPFAKDDSTHRDALQILKQYRLYDKVPHSVLLLLNSQEGGTRGEEGTLEHVYQRVLADNNTALSVVASQAQKAGVQTYVECNIQGEAKLVARKLLCEALKKK